MKEGVSIVICCYNSVSRLKPTLEHIAQQVVPPHISWELIIIDNDSTDGTDEYAEEVWQNLYCHIPFHIVFEPQSGLSYARKKGVFSAQYEYILFCDDDNWLDNYYVTTVFELFENNIDVGVIGGKGKAVSDVSFPKWFANIQDFYAVGPQQDKSGYTKNKAVYGAGMAVRKSIYLDIINNYKLLLTGRKGNKITAGEDYEICSIFMILDYNILYDSNLTFAHFIPKERFTKEYFNKVRKGCVEATIYLIPYYHELNNKPTAFSWYLIRFFKQLTVNILVNCLLFFRKPNKGLFNLMLIFQELKHPLKVYKIRKSRFPLKFTD